MGCGPSKGYPSYGSGNGGGGTTPRASRSSSYDNGSSYGGGGSYSPTAGYGGFDYGGWHNDRDNDGYGSDGSCGSGCSGGSGGGW